MREVVRKNKVKEEGEIEGGRAKDLTAREERVGERGKEEGENRM